MWVKVNEDTWINLDHVSHVYGYPSKKLILFIYGQKIAVDPPYSEKIVELIERESEKSSREVR